MVLIVILTAVVIVAVALEVFQALAGDLFTRFHREDRLRQAVREVQADLAEARKRADTLSGAARAVRQEIARAQEAQADLDREFDKRRKVEPVLVFPLGGADQAGDGSRRFRATITKKLAEEGEPTQAQIWQRRCFVEVRGHSAVEAKVEAYLQFPTGQGYVVGPFAECHEAEPAVEGRAA
jgi:hypothetical protein